MIKALQGLRRINAVGSWAVHPGGPRILSAVTKGLGLDQELIEPSPSVLGTTATCHPRRCCSSLGTLQ
ncbi:hypothetical protein KBY82_01525 [Cyanobium sp. AMD-g]|uniref:hypothetical protein n=1 Tax=Cyanobium sp. AMD-g TaxID=2823699 RepID=UPI0020CFC813|nr:hypothetical protein [Cyanobium sp. AMD-g]MCP9929458.1 hypothetical protein [Cyanobium sp. AMD-g]